MKKIIVFFLLLVFSTHVFGADIIITKQKKKYHGKVIKITEKGFVIRIVDGTVIVLPKSNVSQIIRGKNVFDIENKVRYYIEVRRPYLPFVVLGIAAGVYCVDRFQEYQKERERIKNSIPQDELKNVDDKSGTYLAWSVVSGLFSIGSFYVAFKPLEVKIPMGQLNLSATPNRVMLSFHF